jgi:hypothetical protein
VGEYAVGDVLELHGFLPKSAIETGIECAVDLEQGVEIGETELAFIVGKKICDHEEDFERKLGGWHRDRIEVDVVGRLKR